jgi:hypothetical protein
MTVAKEKRKKKKKESLVARKRSFGRQRPKLPDV